jgi:hypothetical protein
MARDWIWKTLEDKDAISGALPPERLGIVLNKNGELVRYQKPKEIKPPLERFMDSIEEIDLDGETCWLWTGGDQFWVQGGTVISPWRYAYELFIGARVPRGANFRWKCATPRCCLPEHLELIGKYCKEKRVYGEVAR